MVVGSTTNTNGCSISLEKCTFCSHDVRRRRTVVSKLRTGQTLLSNNSLASLSYSRCSADINKTSTYSKFGEVPALLYANRVHGSSTTPTLAADRQLARAPHKNLRSRSLVCGDRDGRTDERCRRLSGFVAVIVAVYKHD